MVCLSVRTFSELIINRTGGRTMFFFTCSMIPGVDLSCNLVSRAKDLCYKSIQRCVSITDMREVGSTAV